jgi:hypothetical protein
MFVDPAAPGPVTWAHESMGCDRSQPHQSVDLMLKVQIPSEEEWGVDQPKARPIFFSARSIKHDNMSQHQPRVKTALT